MDDNKSSPIGYVIGAIVGTFLVSIFFGFGKYEDKSAKEWYSAYITAEDQLESQKLELDQAKDCIITLTDQLDDINSKARFATDEDYEEINDALYNIKTRADPECDGY